MSDTPSGNSAILTTGIDTSGFLKGLKEMQVANEKFVANLTTLSTLAAKTGVKTGEQIGEGIRNAILEYTKDTTKILSSMTANTQAAKQAGAKIGKAVGQGVQEAAMSETADIASRLTASIRMRVKGVSFSEQFRGADTAGLLQAARARKQQLSADLGADDFSDDELRAADAALKSLQAKRKAEVDGISAVRALQKQKDDEELAAFDRAVTEINNKRKAEAAGVTANEALKRRQEAQELAAYDRAAQELRQKRKAEADGIELNRKLQKQKSDEAVSQVNREMEQRVKLLEMEERARREAAKAGVSANLADASFNDPTTSARTKLRMARNAQTMLASGASRVEVEAKYGTSAIDANVDSLRRLAAAQMNSTAAMRAWSLVGNEAHSMARGLAGSLGVLWLTWGSTIPIAAGAAIGMSMRSVLSAGKELEYQLKFVSELTDRSAVSFKDFFDAVGSSMTAPLEAAKGLRALAQSGLDTQQAMAALKPTLDLAVVGELSVTEAAYAATGAMHAFNMGFAEISRVGDVFAKAAAISNTSVAGITESMKQASTVAEFYGITVEQTGAALALLAKRNIEGSAAGTAFRNMMVELTTPSEKAKKAMASLGLELYDNEKRLKGFEEIMKDLYSTLSGLDEKSRLAALNDIFNERGVKAAAAILGDFTTFEKLLREMGDAGGYTSQVMSGLSDTVQGQLQIAVSNLQKTFMRTFDEVQFGTRNIARDLADLAKSEGLQSMITTMAKFTVDFTRALIDNKDAVITVVQAWVGLKVLGSLAGVGLTVVQSFTSMSVAARMAGGSFNFMNLAASNLWRALTGPIGLVLGLAGAYLMLRTNVDEGSEALRASNERMRDLIEETDRAADAQAALNAQLIERNRLLSEGKNPDQVASGDVAKGAKELEDAALKLDRLKTEYAKMTAERLKNPPDQTTIRGKAQNDELNKKYAEIAKAQAELDTRVADFSAFMQKQDRLKREKVIGKEESDLERDLNTAKELNRQLEVRREKGDKKLPGELDERQLRSMTADGRKLELERVRQGLQTGSYEAQGKGSAAAARREQQALFNAQRKSAADEFNDAVRRQDMLYERELFSIDKQFQYREITEDQYNDLRMQASFEYLRQISALEQDAIYKLGDLKDNAEKKSQKLQLENAAERMRKANEERQLRESLDRDKKTEEAKYAFNEDMRAIGRRLPGLEERALKDSRDKLKNRDIGIVSEVEAAGMEAATNATKAYTDILSDLLKKKEEAIDRFGAESAQVAEAIWLENGLRMEMERVAEQARENGKELGRYYRTTEFGAKKAFKAYTEEASNAATQMERLLSNAFKGAEDALVQFVKTGKLDFRSLAESIISDLIRIQVQQSMLQMMGGTSGMLEFIQLGISILSGGNSVTTADMDAWNPMKDLGDVSWNANGNVFGPWGKIDAFAKGDVFNKATMFRHGGSRLGVLGEAGPEAIMPVERDSNGRLGVKVVGREGGGGGGVVVNQSVHLTVQGSADDPQKLAAVVSSMVRRESEKVFGEIVMREKRSGGVLA